MEQIMEINLKVNLEDYIEDIKQEIVEHTDDEGCDSKIFNKITLKQSIIDDIKFQIKQSIKNGARDQIDREIKKSIEAEIPTLLKETMTTFFENNKLILWGKEITISEFIKQELSKNFNNSYQNQYNSVLEQKCKSFVEDLKKRYDLAFAAQIVQRMAELKMLKDDRIVELLTPKENGNN